MSLRLAITCPFCKRPMATSAAFSGQMIACPNCRGEFVLQPPGMTPQQPAGTAGLSSPLPPPFQLDSVGGGGGAAAAVAAPPLTQAAPPVSAPVAAQSLVVATLSASAPAPVAAPQPPANTARFKAASLQTPAVAPAADGKLPTLQLADAAVNAKGADGGEKAVPLWLASLAVVASTVISVILLVSDPQGTDSASSRRAQARRDLALYYGSEAVQLRPYQVLLREAQQAHSRGDFETERKRYRQVLALLRAEGRSQYVGLTGSPKDDEELARLLSDILRND